MKKLLFLYGLAFILTLGPVSCNIEDLDIAGNNSGKYITKRVDYSAAYEEVNFYNYAIPYSFGPSVGGRIFRPGESTAGIYNISNFGTVPKVLDAENKIDIDTEKSAVCLATTAGGGKIAGSEDGILYYFKEVDMSKNFIMEADFEIKAFGITTNATAADMDDKYTVNDTNITDNGQAAWGIMVRDELPELSGTNQASVRAKYFDKGIGDGVAVEGGTNFLTSQTSTATSGNYSIGSRGGDANMFLVGATKWGLRAYWRQGVRWDGMNPLRRWNPDANDGAGAWETSSETGATGNRTSISGATEYMNHGTTKFSYFPDADGDYSLYTGTTGAAEGVPTVPARWDYPERDSVYRVRLERTNNGFDYRITRISGPDTRKQDGVVMSSYVQDTAPYGSNKNPFNRLPSYDIVNSINKEKYYVGVCAARNAVVWVRNIKYWEADAEDCEPYLELLPKALMPSLEVVSPPYYGGQNRIWVKSNVDGRLVVTQDGKRIPDEVIFKEWVTEPTNGMGEPRTMWMVPIQKPKIGANTFQLQFNPNPVIPPELKNRVSEGYVIGSTTQVNRTFVMERKEYSNGTGDIYISPDGKANNDGTRGSPLDIRTAINYVQPGQKIIMLDGEYVMTNFVEVPRYNEGNFEKEKVLKAENRYMAALDFKKDPRMKGPGGQYTSHGLLADGSYWKFEGFHVRNAGDNCSGVKIGGHNNTFSYLLVYNSGDTGIQISGINTEPKRYWPSYNTVEYCDSFNNQDQSETNADGFAAKLCVGEGNKFLWNISHNNNDDGWDLFAKKETGAPGAVLFFGNVSYGQRTMLSLDAGGNRRRGTNGAGNAFKLGGEGLSVKHDVRHSICFDNPGTFTGNSNPDPQQYFCTAIGSGGNSLSSISNGPRYNSISSNGAVTAFNTAFTTTQTHTNVLWTWAEAFPGVPPPPEVTDNKYSWQYAWTWKPELQAFMKRLPDGRPDFRSKASADINNPDWVYKPFGPEWEPGKTYSTGSASPYTLVNGSMSAAQLSNLPRGAWAFFVPVKPEPDFLPR